MAEPGYYRHPTIHGETIVFVCEDDLWTVPAGGGLARRLTSGRGEVLTPHLSPDGRWVAFMAREEGPLEVYVIPAEGGEPVRRTFLGGTLGRVAGWSRDGREVLFASNAMQPMLRMIRLMAVPRDGGLARELPYGIARAVSLGPGRGVVLGRHGADPARWKRYRGGTVGQIWIDQHERGHFERLIETGGNLSNPMWIGQRIFFLSDHEGIGNIYSCDLGGHDLRRHTHHRDFYARNPTTDGRRIVYHAGADLFVYDPKADTVQRVQVEFRSPRTQRQRRFVSPSRFLEDYAPHPKDHRLALTIRGKVFTIGNWTGAPVQHGPAQGVRYRLARWLPDGQRLVAVTDERGEEELVIFWADGRRPHQILPRLPIGCAMELVVAPKGQRVAVANHRHELLVVNLKRHRAQVIDRSEHAPIAGMAWSPDGRWLAYGCADGPRTSAIRLVRLPGGRPRAITQPVLRDFAPAFDPEGNYLYFLSVREFDPVYDTIHFELGFPRGVRPCLVTLRRDLTSPFTGERPPKTKSFRIDLDGIEQRAVPFPIPEGRYTAIVGIRGAALFTSRPVHGSLGRSWIPSPPEPNQTLEVWRFEDRRKEVLLERVSDFRLSADARTIVVRLGERLRALPAGAKPPEKEEGQEPSPKSGWIDLDRVRVEVDPAAEWRQMFHEAWRAMRDHFWVADMSGVDWKMVRERYRPLAERVATRGEFSDLVWEMQGELGTSHCYELSGDYRPPPRYDVGFLAADFAYDPRTRGYRITHIVRGDPGDERTSSPLVAPGVNLREGDVIVAIGGRRLGPKLAPQELLVHRAGQDVTLTLASGRTLTVRAMPSDQLPLYREWVRKRRDRVHRRSRKRAGYVHIPDMSPWGYAEFHRQFLVELDRPGLIVDVRFNGGGHVSQLLLEKLSRRRLAWVKKRWGAPEPYPEDSPAGPIVCVTNEEAGSDGDIFSHCFKLLGLGPLVGRRTWGGVIGIWPRHPLVDGSCTTQPEHSFWFRDVGFGIENHGTEPDVDVDVAPQQMAAGEDPQLDRAVDLLLELLERHPPLQPRFDPLPRRAPPVLPDGSDRTRRRATSADRR